MKRYEVTLGRAEQRAIIGPIKAKDSMEARETALSYLEANVGWYVVKTTELVSV